MSHVGLRVQLLLLLVFLLFVSCIGGPVRLTTPVSPTIVTRLEAYTIMPTRIASSQGALSVALKIKRVIVSKQQDNLLDSHIVKVEIQIRNISTHDVVVKTPASWGFDGPNDLGFRIGLEDGTELSVSPSSSNPTEVRAGPHIRNTVITDFVRLTPGQVSVTSIDLPLPLVYIEASGYVGKLPSGKYLLSVEYGNLSIGYDLPLGATTQVYFENIDDRDAWYDSTMQIVDLDAWVGWGVTSNEVEFTIP